MKYKIVKELYDIFSVRYLMGFKRHVFKKDGCHADFANFAELKGICNVTHANLY